MMEILFLDHTSDHTHSYKESSFPHKILSYCVVPLSLELQCMANKPPAVFVAPLLCCLMLWAVNSSPERFKKK